MWRDTDTYSTDRNLNDFATRLSTETMWKQKPTHTQKCKNNKILAKEAERKICFSSLVSGAVLYTPAWSLRRLDCGERFCVPKRIHSVD